MEQLTREKAISERDLALKELMISKQGNFRKSTDYSFCLRHFFCTLDVQPLYFKKKSNVGLIQSNSELEDTLKRLHYPRIS
ncbi:MAG: hypothetical protein IPP46_18140 [Bacteroidetes bacterium]|nr:hypothetical protein [Bacteroidota bacterium]